MSPFEKRFVFTKSKFRYFALAGTEEGGDWMHVDHNPFVGDGECSIIYAPAGIPYIYSRKRLALAHGEPAIICCLPNFLRIISMFNQIRSALLDDQYLLTLKPWRWVHETVATYRDNDKTYYLEGCRHYRKPSDPYWIISSGFFDERTGGCRPFDCPFNDIFDEDSQEDRISHFSTR